MKEVFIGANELEQIYSNFIRTKKVIYIKLSARYRNLECAYFRD